MGLPSRLAWARKPRIGRERSSAAISKCHNLRAGSRRDCSRAKEGAALNETSGVLVDGTKIDGIASLRNSLVSRSDQFARVVTEKMLTYALGRGVEYQDMPLVRSIVRDVLRKRCHQVNALTAG